MDVRIKCICHQNKHTSVLTDQLDKDYKQLLNERPIETIGHKKTIICRKPLRPKWRSKKSNKTHESKSTSDLAQHIWPPNVFTLTADQFASIESKEMYKCCENDCDKRFVTKDLFDKHMKNHLMTTPIKSDQQIIQSAEDMISMTTNTIDNKTNDDKQQTSVLLNRLKVVSKISPKSKTNGVNKQKVVIINKTDQLVAIHDSCKVTDGQQSCSPTTTSKPEVISQIKCQFKSCVQLFDTLDDYYKHLDEIHRKLECNVCAMKFADDMALNRHIKSHKWDQLETIKHKSTVDNIDPAIDSIKPAVDKTSIDKTDVNTSDEVMIAFKCDRKWCEMPFDSEEALKIHKNTNHVNVVRCQVNGCGKVCSGRLNGFASHMKAHRESKVYDKDFYKCNVGHCQYKNKSIFFVNIHIKNRHSIDRFICPDISCGKSFKSIESQKHHTLEAHSTDKPFLCRHLGCDKRFATQQFLDSHKRSHLELVRLKCTVPDCTVTLKSKYSLSKHLMTHQSKTLKCEWPGCDYATNNNNLLTSHQLIHRVDVWYYCEWPGCKSRFKVKTALKSHTITIHHKRSDHLRDWPECGKRFALKGYLRTHMKLHLRSK